jgi:hypothetical protein
MLGPGEWLDGDAIDAACISLMHSASSKFCHKGSWMSGWWECHYLLNKTMENYNYSKVCEFNKRGDYIDELLLSEYEVLFLPFHQPGHWVLFVCSIKTRRIEMYDSLWNASRSNLASIFAKPFLNALFSLERNEKWEIKNHGISMPQQDNGFDCGIFVIHTVWCLLRSIPVTAPPANFRETVLQWILL